MKFKWGIYIGIITAVSASPGSLHHNIGTVPNLIESHEKIPDAPIWIAADIKYRSEECLRYLQDKG
jgi:hypothetical protein